mgnify:CR=1 FL=1
MNLEDKIRVIKDFPKEGIEYMDITTVLKDGKVYKEVIDECIKLAENLDYNIIVGPEARGFLVGAPMSYATSTSFVPIRKPGKLPAEKLSYEYDLEYGTDILEVHKDAINPGDKVLIVDDLLATGGTVQAVTKMIEDLGGEVVGLIFLIELTFLDGRDKLKEYNVQSILKK